MAPTEDPTATRTAGRGFPAYGPVDAALGYGLFYVVVDRVTPAVVDALGGAIASLSPAAARLGLALMLWFVLVVTALDQGRRQLVALGVLEADPTRSRWDDRLAGPGRGVPAAASVGRYLAGVAGGGVVALWTFEAAIETLVSLIRAASDLDVWAVAVGDVAVLVGFFLAFAVATRSLDRLVVGGVRALLDGWS